MFEEGLRRMWADRQTRRMGAGRGKGLELYVSQGGSHLSLSHFLSPQSAAAAPSPVLGNIPPNDGMPGGPIPPGFFQVRAGPPRSPSP